MEPTPVGAQRRIRALMYQRWSPEAIEQATGLSASELRRAIERRRGITQPFAAAVADAYERLWNAEPPMTTAAQRQAAEEAARQAHYYGAPPMAWDDDVIDDPDGAPAHGWRPSTRGHGKLHDSAGLAEEVDFFRRYGGYRDADLSVLADRLGVTLPALQRGLARARQADRKPERQQREMEIA